MKTTLLFFVFVLLLRLRIVFEPILAENTKERAKRREKRAKRREKHEWSRGIAFTTTTTVTITPTP